MVGQAAWTWSETLKIGFFYEEAKLCCLPNPGDILLLNFQISKHFPQITENSKRFCTVGYGHVHKTGLKLKYGKMILKKGCNLHVICGVEFCTVGLI